VRFVSRRKQAGTFFYHFCRLTARRTTSEKKNKSSARGESVRRSAAGAVDVATAAQSYRTRLRDSKRAPEPEGTAPTDTGHRTTDGARARNTTCRRLGVTPVSTARDRGGSPRASGPVADRRGRVARPLAAATPSRRKRAANSETLVSGHGRTGGGGHGIYAQIPKIFPKGESVVPI